MKKYSRFILLLFLLSANQIAASPFNDLPDRSNPIAFTENKGQDHDQNYQPRPDVLYGVMTGNMAVQIKKTGVSYQLYRVDSYKEVEDPKSRTKHKEADQQTMYRVDMNWLNWNKRFTKTEDEVLPGYSKYYLESCPDGALYVKSYKDARLKDLYQGIDLHHSGEW